MKLYRLSVSVLMNNRSVLVLWWMRNEFGSVLLCWGWVVFPVSSCTDGTVCASAIPVLAWSSGLKFWRGCFQHRLSALRHIAAYSDVCVCVYGLGLCVCVGERGVKLNRCSPSTTWHPLPSSHHIIMLSYCRGFMDQQLQAGSYGSLLESCGARSWCSRLHLFV